MKVFSRKIIVALIMIAAITSCSKDDDGGKDPHAGGVATGSLTAKVNGEIFNSLAGEAMAIVTISEGKKVIAIAGEDEQGRSIGLNYSNFTGVGTYNIFDPSSDEDIGMGIYMEGDGDDTQIWMLPMENGPIGKLVITDYSANDRIKGTFHFEAWNPFTQSIKKVSEGAFNVPVN